jgi:hypothetical protein
MVPKESRIFSKQFIRIVKMERKREKWTHTRKFEVEMFFSCLKMFIPFSR